MKRRILSACVFTVLFLFGSLALAEGTFEILTDMGTSFFGHFMTLSFDGQGISGNTNMYWSPGTGWITQSDGNFSRITGNGMKVVGTLPNPDGFNMAAIWDSDTGWNFIDPLPGGEPCDTGLMSGYAGNFDGTMATGLAWNPGCDAEAFLWTEGVGTIGLGRNDVEDRASRGSDISDDGSTVGGFFENNACGRRPAIWVDGGDVQFPLGEDACGEVLGVNSDGSMLCGSAIAPDAFIATSFFWSEMAGWVDIGMLPSDEFNGSLALGIADNSWVVGYNSNPFFGFPEALIWTPEEGLMSFIDFLDLWEVEYPEGTYFYSCTDISADGSTIVGNFIADGGFFLEAFKVTLEGVVAAFMSDFEVAALNGGVELSFQIHGDAVAGDFELIASRDALQWTVPVTREGAEFVAHDDSPHLAAGGSVTYSLYYFAPDGRQLLQSKSVELDETPAFATRLIGASPNPFNPQTTVKFTLARSQYVKVSVFDMQGRRIADLTDGVLGAGEHPVQWSGTDLTGRAVASGTYVIHMQSDEGIQMQKMALVR